MFCELYYLPIYLLSVRSLSPTLAGVGLMPITGALLPTSILVGALMTRLGRYTWAIWSGWALTLVATALLILLSTSTPTYGWALLFVPVGLGHGLVLMSLNFCVQALADTKDVAYAAAMYTFLRTFGMCVGVAVGGTVFQNRLLHHLVASPMHLPNPESVARDAEGFIAVLKALPVGSGERRGYEEAYAESFRNVFEVLTGVAALGGLASVFIGHASMDRELDSEHVLQRGKGEEKGSN